MEKQKFYLVAADALPEVFLRVAEAKRMLQVGEAATVGDAARQVGISRSAFYKYKDAVQPFQNMHAGHIITFYALLKDNPGVLSNYLAIFANSGANILTINQTIPTNGCAGVTISAETGDMSEELAEVRDHGGIMLRRKKQAHYVCLFFLQEISPRLTPGGCVLQGVTPPWEPQRPRQQPWQRRPSSRQQPSARP